MHFPDSTLKQKPRLSLKMVKQRKSVTPVEVSAPVEVKEGMMNGTPKKKLKDKILANGHTEADMEVDNSPKVNGITSGKKKSKAAQSPTLGELAKKSEKPQTSTETPSNSEVNGSMAYLLTQGLMAHDAPKIDTVLRTVKLDVINATLNELQVTQIVPLLLAIDDRLRTRQTLDIRPWILWIQCIFSAHMTYLVSVPKLEGKLGSLMEWMKNRVGHQHKLLALHGKLSLVVDQIQTRSNNPKRVAPQPLIVFNNDVVDSDEDDLETIGSDESGVSSEDDWWDDANLRDVGDNDDEEDDDEDDDGAVSSDDEVISRQKMRNLRDDDSDDDDDVMDSHGLGCGGDGEESSEGDENNQGEDDVMDE